MTSPDHGVIALNFGSELRAFVRSHSLGVVMTGARFLLRDTPPLLRIPDTAFISRTNLPTGRLRGGHFRGAPDLAIEVVSPNDKAGELILKTGDYLAAGTQQVWIVEPGTRTVTVYRPGGAARVYGADDTLDGGDLLPGLALPVRRPVRLWRGGSRYQFVLNTRQDSQCACTVRGVPSVPGGVIPLAGANVVW